MRTEQEGLSSLYGVSAGGVQTRNHYTYVPEVIRRVEKLAEDGAIALDWSFDGETKGFPAHCFQARKETPWTAEHFWAPQALPSLRKACIPQISPVLKPLPG